MPRRSRLQSSTRIYHVTIRAINRMQIFATEDDYRLFLHSIMDIMEKHSILLHAYCMMGNHIHLLIEELEESLSNFMKAFEDSFVYRYNQKYERCGILFQGRFHSVPIEDKRQFLNVLRYIHQNPMRAGLEDKPGTYPWSSYSGYFHHTNKELVCRDLVLHYFPEEHQLREFLETPLSQSELSQYRSSRFLDTERTIRLMCEIAEVNDLAELQSLQVEKRNQLINDLKGYPLSASCIGRILGMSKTQVLRIRHGVKE